MQRLHFSKGVIIGGAAVGGLVLIALALRAIGIDRCKAAGDRMADCRRVGAPIRDKLLRRDGSESVGTNTGKWEVLSKGDVQPDLVESTLDDFLRVVEQSSCHQVFTTSEARQYLEDYGHELTAEQTQELLKHRGLVLRSPTETERQAGITDSQVWAKPLIAV